ncbi:transmembrane protein 18 [Arctopsyche grandis]|uniref:transmembrane protein 18 n=1 Tax=Arctopsyche grandis TaxID=121162 RepID=UPI00406D9EC8
MLFNMESDFAEVTDINGLLTYLHSIDWADPLFLWLLSFHVIITLTSFNTRNYGNFQIFLFFILLLLVFFSESINEYASKNWTSLSRQQYFDSRGLFISMVFSIPILLNCMIMVGRWLYESTQIAESLRKAQLKKQLQRQSQLKAKEAQQ